MNPTDQKYEEMDDDYDFEYDRICSYPCEICGETWESEDEWEEDDESYY